MNISLLKAAFGIFALTASAFMANAQTPTLTEMWRTHAGFGSANAAVRGGNAANGKIYITDGNYITTVEKDNVDTVFVSDKAMNKGLFVDRAGNMLVNRNWPTGATNWNQYTLISADGATVKELTLEVPDGSLFVGNRADMCGRVVGDFFSEQGGICYLTANGATNALPILIKNGELVVPEYTSEAISETASNTMGSAVPAFSSMDEMDEDMYFTQYYHNSTAIQSWNIRGFNEDGEAYTVPAPELNEDGAVVVDGIAMYPTSQNGFDVVNLGGKNYYFRHYTEYKGQHWGPEFLVNDEEGNVVAYTHMYDPEAGWGKYNKTGNGGGLIVEKISETAANVYMVFANDAYTDGVCAMYRFSIAGDQPELPALYAAGSFQGWDPVNPVEFRTTPEGYAMDIESESNVNFKLSTAKGDWDTFNSQLLGVAGGMLEPNVLTKLVAGQDGDNTLPAGKYTITVSTDLATIIAEGEAYKTAPELYLRGEFNSWGYDDASKFASDYTVNENDEVIYTLALDALAGEVKIADANWGISLGKAESDIEGEGTYVLGRQSGAGNIKVAEMTNVKLTLTYPMSVSKEATLKVECDPIAAPVHKSAFAYGLRAEATENGYTVNYALTTDAVSAELVLTSEEGDVVAVPLEATKGEHTATVDMSQLSAAEYNWEVKVVSEPNAAGGEVFFAEAPVTKRGSVITFTDPEYETYGYTVVGHNVGTGFDIYNPAGELVATEVHKNDPLLGSDGNQSNPLRGAEHMGHALVAAWGDDAHGVTAFNPLDPEEALYSVFEGEMASSGLISYNGVGIGSGTPCVAIQGKGENARMYTFDEDVLGNAIAVYNIGTSRTITTAPTSWGLMSLNNTNVEIQAVESGIFATQVRANFMDTGSFSLEFITNDGERIWTSINKEDWPEDMIADCNSGLAINKEGNLLAISGKTGIRIFDLSFDEYDEPVLNYRSAIDVTTTDWATMRFDAANNLHYYGRGVGYSIYAIANDNPVASTPGNGVIKGISTGVEDINIDAQAEVEYFNLQGISVKAENLTPGVYVRRQGGVATKVIIK